MSTLERLERANPVPEADRLLSAPGAMDDFILAAKERSGIVQTTKDQALIAAPTTEKTSVQPTQPTRKRRLIPVLAAVAAVVAAVVIAVVALSGNEPDVANNQEVPPGPESADAIVPYAGPTLVAGTLSVGTLTADGLPFFSIGGSDGFEIDLLEEVTDRLDLGLVKLATGPVFSFDRFQDGLGSDFDLVAAALTVSEEREAQVAFSTPTFRNRFAMAVDVSRNPDLRSLADLGAGHRIYAGPSDPPIAVYSWVSSRVSPDVQFAQGSLQALQSGLIDAYIIDEPVLARDIADYPTVEVVELIDPGHMNAFAIDPGNPELLAAVNGALQSMIDDGTYQEIYDRWFDDPFGSVAR
jgi:ABC-type amino acid transport substrate-binding protein